MSKQESISRSIAAANMQSRSLPLCVLLAAFFLVAILLPPYNAQGAAFWSRMPGLCLFHATTGLPCPGCGITRSVVLCAHGLWHEAAWLHPLGPALFFGAFIALLYHAANLLQLRRFTSRRIIHPWLPYFTLAAFLLVWITRLVGWLPSPP